MYMCVCVCVYIYIYIKRRLPWWFRGEGSTLQCNRRWFDPWPRKIPHALVQPSPCTVTAKPMCLEPVLRNQ